MTPELLRIIDANFNRSREALRVIEEYARFVLDDQSSTAELKKIRHELSQIVSELAPNQDLLAARDTAGDVGTAISLPTEMRRADASAVCAAAAQRLAESLRALEEYGKVIGPGPAARIESLRYRAYKLHKRLGFSNDRHHRLRQARLCVLVTASRCRIDWLETIERVARAGAHLIQLREKELEDRQLLERASAAAERCRIHGTLFIINDRPDIARLCHADGVHLGQDDLPVAAARRIAGPQLLVGVSTHDPAQLDHAIDLHPDYIAVGPIFDSKTKPGLPLAGPEFLRHAARQTDLPLLAIGGVEPDNLSRLHPQRPVCLAVCSAVISRPDPEAAVRELLLAIRESNPTSLPGKDAAKSTA